MQMTDEGVDALRGRDPGAPRPAARHVRASAQDGAGRQRPARAARAASVGAGRAEDPRPRTGAAHRGSSGARRAPRPTSFANALTSPSARWSSWRTRWIGCSPSSTTPPTSSTWRSSPRPSANSTTTSPPKTRTTSSSTEGHLLGPPTWVHGPRERTVNRVDRMERPSSSGAASLGRSRSSACRSTRPLTSCSRPPSGSSRPAASARSRPAGRRRRGAGRARRRPDGRAAHAAPAGGGQSDGRRGGEPRRRGATPHHRGTLAGRSRTSWTYSGGRRAGRRLRQPRSAPVKLEARLAELEARIAAAETEPAVTLIVNDEADGAAGGARGRGAATPHLDPGHHARPQAHGLEVARQARDSPTTQHARSQARPAGRGDARHRPDRRGHVLPTCATRSRRRSSAGSSRSRRTWPTVT